MSYWCDDRALYLDQRRRDADQERARLARLAAQKGRLYEKLYSQLSAAEALSVCGPDGKRGDMNLTKRGERILRYLRARRSR